MFKKKNVFVILGIVAFLVLGVGIVSYAAEAYEIRSQGRIIFNNDTEETSDDVVFDAQDLVTLKSMVETGKGNLATVLNTYPNTNVQSIDTFDNLAAAIDVLTEIPDCYYYDKTTEGDDCSRYIYIDGSYYPCDQNGVQTSEDPLSGTITIVEKDDETTPADGEIHLIKYEKTDMANLSAGFAGYADKALVLGSGSDNISYRNQGTGRCYYLGTGKSYDISSIVGAENVGNYSKSNFIVTMAGISASATNDADDDHIGHDATGSMSVSAPSVSYNSSTGVATVSGATYSLTVTAKYATAGTSSGNVTTYLYFLDNVKNE